MATAPQYTTTPNAGARNVALTAANTAKDGTGTTALLYTAGASGSRLRRIIMKPSGTNVQTCIRFFINNGSDPTVAANNTLLFDYTLPATTNSETVAQPQFEMAPEIDLPNGFRIYCCLATAVSAGWQVSALGADY